MEVIPMGINEVGSSAAVIKGRSIKFTPEILQQIKEFVAQDKSREEIAGIVGATVGSLQVTCSRFGISLRRPRRERNLHDQGVPYSGTRGRSSGGTSVRFPFEQLDQFLQSATPHANGTGTQQASSATIALTMRYKGHERARQLPLDAQDIRRLAFEASVRNMSVGEFVTALISASVETGIDQVLDH
jgi:hypothetical protein